MRKQMRSVISLLLAILLIAGSTPLIRVQAADDSVDLTNGLLAHYDFENVTGTTVPNTADAAYSAVISGSAAVVDLEGITTPGKALQLGSAAGGMQLTNIVNASASSFSVSLWYQATATSSSNVNLVQAGTMDGSTGRTILILAPDSTYYTYLTGDNAKVTTASAISPTTWQHITVSYDQAANKVYFFVNGVADRADGLTLSGTPLDTGDMIIGRHRNANEGQFNGFIDEVRVYNRVLSAEEAAAIYETTRDAYSIPPVGDITLTVDAADVERIIDSDSIFGINHRYAFNGYGSFDSANMEIKDDFLALYQDAGFDSIRYPGGTISNLFNWKTTIGPVEQRKNQIHGFYNNAGQGGIAPNFGLAEIGTFAESVGSEMVYVYSLGRGNAQDAADLIEYLNAKVGTNPNGGIDWAAVRAANGHAEPYNVRYFEIGNEMQQAYGTAYDGTASQGYWTTSVSTGSETAYIDGGTATFTQQYAVCEEDWNATASLSDGSANLVRYMRYANVNPKMEDGSGNIVDDPDFRAVNDGVSVYVGGTQWTVVDSFQNSGASDEHVVIDYSTGAIRFGDGVNGAIPESGQQIYVSYSVEREGFIAVSQAMREITDAINEAEGTGHEIHIYSSYESQGFITKMADRSANDLYDGLTIHPYSGTPDGTGETFYDSAMYKAEATGIAHVQNYVNMLPEGKVPVISEYGIFRSTDALVRSQTHAVYIAKVLMEYVRLGSPYIQKHCLVDWYSSGADSLGPTQQAVIQAVAGTDADTTTGEGTFTFFSTPSAHVFQMLNTAFADNVIATQFSTTPTMSNGARTLSALASKDADGTVYLAIVNASREADYALTLDLQNFDLEGAAISAQVLTADSFDAQNTPDHPDNVTVTTENVTVDPENFTYTVPRHSFVILTIDPIHAAPTTQVAVNVGETITITDDTGNYQDAVVTDELDESIAAVTVTGTATPAEKTLVGEVTELVSGGRYILYSDRGQKPMTNAAASVVSMGSTMTGLSLSGTVDAMADNAIWTITKTDGGYTVQDADGKYLSIAMSNVTLSDTVTTVNIAYTDSYWTLRNGDAYLNDAGAAGTCASGYSSATGFGSQWSIYAVGVTPASASTWIDITGVSAGTTHVQVGPTRYEIVVSAVHTHSHEALVTAPTCTEDGYTTYTCACGDSYVADETEALGHSFENGICTLCGTGIAVNEATGTAYATLSDALHAAVEGDTVKLLGDAAEGYVLVYPGITLDLNGCELTASYAVGFNAAHIVDNGGTGKLNVARENVVLDEENGMVPIYDGTGYRFTRAGFAIEQDNTHTGEGIRINAVAYPVNTDVVDLLKDGTADNNLQVMIVLTWDHEQGTGSQKFVFTDDVVSQVYSSNDGTFAGYSKMFSMVITGIDGIENLKANIMLVSGTNTAYGTALVSIN